MVNFNAICNDFFDADDYEYVFFFGHLIHINFPALIIPILLI